MHHKAVLPSLAKLNLSAHKLVESILNVTKLLKFTNYNGRRNVLVRIQSILVRRGGNTTTAHVNITEDIPTDRTLPPLDPVAPEEWLAAASETAQKCPGSSVRTIIRLRSSNLFAGWPEYYAGATDTPYCTICEDTTTEGRWEHTLSSCLHPVIKGMRINRHNELVRNK